MIDNDVLVTLKPKSYDFETGCFAFSQTDALQALQQLTAVLFPTIRQAVPGEPVVAYRDGGVYVVAPDHRVRRVTFDKRPYAILEYLVLHHGTTTETLRQRFFKRDEYAKEATSKTVERAIDYLNTKLKEYGVKIALDLGYYNFYQLL